jgi:O-methyltransferase involved in polyketide biosynthesis
VEQHALESISCFETVDAEDDEVTFERVAGLVGEARMLLGDITKLKAMKKRKEAQDAARKGQKEMIDEMEDEWFYIPIDLAVSLPLSSWRLCAHSH